MWVCDVRYRKRMEEAQYKLRCADLRRQVGETERLNESLYATIERTKRLIQRARLERSLLLEKLEQAAGPPLNASADSPPPSPLVSNPEPTAQTTTKRRIPRERDPRLPKKPVQSPFHVFQERHSNDSTFDAADAWKKLSEQDREPFVEAATEDRNRYLREMASVPPKGLTSAVQKERERAIKALKEKKDSIPGTGDVEMEDATEDEKAGAAPTSASESEQDYPHAPASSEPPSEI